ncbi:MAG: sigma-70 family RNA polymerase sigma factor [Bacillus sp. (in: firmicutes)]
MKTFNELAKDYTPMIHKIIHSLRIYKDREEYFNIGLEALWEAYLKYEEGKSTFSTFAYTMIRGRLLNHLRSSHMWESKNICIFDDEDFSPVGSTNDQYFTMELLELYCDGLTDRQRDWLIETFVHQKTLQEIAVTRHVKVCAVKSWRRETLKKLRRRFGIR